MSGTRRLAAIMAVDVVGYSRLMGEDEAGTARAVREHRDAARPTVVGSGGRVVKTMGDGLLLEFPSVVAAVESAVAIQKLMVARNAEIPEAKRIVYRIGVNLGDVLIEGDDILGDGVNIAARLEAACEPGGVLISSTAFEHTRGKLEVEFVDLGERALKNIVRPVRVYALSPAAVAASADRVAVAAPENSAARGWRRWIYAIAACAILALAVGWYELRSWSHSPSVAASSATPATAPKLSIVVLPFENLSGDPEQEYFADGLTEDLTTDLSHLAGSFVIARNTAFTYKGKPIDVRAIGRELGVRYALEGSVRRLGESVSVNAQLISTETGAHIWADRFEGERSHLGQLQVEFVSRLANSLDVELVKAEALRSMRERATNPDAADFALRGMAAYNAPPTDAAVKLAIESFEQALQLDPNFAQVLAYLSLVLSTKVTNFRSENPLADLERAESLAKRAVEIQPQNGLAHLARAYSLQARVFAGKSGEWETLIAEAEAAISDDRNLADAYANLGFNKVFLGRAAEGFSGVETALRLSPRDPQLGNWEFYVCHLHSHLAQWEEAIEWCRKSIVTQPTDSIWSYLDIASAYAWTGRDAEAKLAVAEVLKTNPDFTVQTFNAIKWTENPTFKREYARLSDGLLKAGLPGGKSTSN